MESLLRTEQNILLGMVLHVCDPSSSGGRGRRTASSKLSEALINLARSLLKIKKGVEMWLSG